MTDDTALKDDPIHDPAAESAAGPAPSASEVALDVAAARWRPGEILGPGGGCGPH
jgi:hypothetical protein